MLRSLPRLLLLCGLLLLPVLLAAPWVTGRVAEQVYWQALSGLQQPGVVVLSNGSYQRSYGEAKGTTTVTLAAREGRPALTLTLATTVEHRLTGVRSRTRVSADNGLFPQGEPQLQLRAGLTGGLQGDFTVPALHWPGAESRALTLDNARGTLSWRSGQQLELSAALDSLLRGQSETPAWALTEGQLRVNGAVNRERLNARLNVKASELQVQDSELGRQSLAARVEDFHGPSVVAIVSALEALYGQRETLTLTAQAEEQRLAFNRLSDNLQSLSVHGGELTIQLNSGNDGLGAMDGQLRLTYPALPNPYSQLPVSLLQHAEGETRLRLDPGYAQTLPEALQPLLSHWQAKNWLQSAPEGLVFSARLQERLLLLDDGRAIKLPPLL